MNAVLNAQEVLLIDAFRKLSPDAAEELSRLILRLASISPERRIDWSDAWSEEDLKDFRAASVRRLDQDESEQTN